MKPVRIYIFFSLLCTTCRAANVELVPHPKRKVSPAKGSTAYQQQTQEYTRQHVRTLLPAALKN